MDKLDHPWEEVLQQANLRVSEGHEVYQKWTCAHCGARQGMMQPNTFYTQGKCEECGKITNIKEKGHNFLLYMRLTDGKE